MRLVGAPVRGAGHAPLLTGRFLTVEGISGAGKSTQARRLARWFEAQGLEVVMTRDPGGTPVGEAIRRLLLESTAPVAPEAEVALFFADRAQNLAEVIRPALRRGAVVIGDRFTDSTIAYQGYGRGVPLPRLLRIDEAVTGGFRPDRTVLLDLPAATGCARLAEADRIEREAVRFHERVREGFLDLAREAPERIVRIDATGEPGAVWERVRGAVA